MEKNVLAVCAAVMFCAGIVSAQSVNEPKLYKIGNAEVRAIADSTGEGGLGLFDGVDDKVLQKYVPGGAMKTAVMTFLIKTGKETIIVDTGYGQGLMAGLAKLKVKPEDITIVLITHMHGDHIGGLISGGKAAFPNAKIKIGRIERDFWLNDESVSKFPARKNNFDMAKRVAEVYGAAVEVFEFGGEIVPGITSMDSRGHTPGHTAYMLESDGKKLLFIGDIINAAAVQMPRPDISSRYDMDPKQAALTREKILSIAAKDNLEIAGAHLFFPGIGGVKSNKEKGYELRTE
ncbi:MAG: MBL fold metallo-hydrolase [Endomicrobium sp.]|nr:MBL fold metallo-hydrolase [Endomicrobium sp.]